jgi:hypothetical protein
MFFRRVSLSVFLLFYFLSSFAASYSRAAEGSKRFQHAAMETHGIELADSTEASRDAYPRFREAKKKVGIDFDFRLPVLFEVSPVAVTREFSVDGLYWETHSTYRAITGRAPPSRA